MRERAQKADREKPRRVRLKNVTRPVFYVVLTFFVLLFSYYAFSSWNSRVWRDNARITIAVATENPTLYSYNPQNQSIYKISIPQNTQTEASGGYGVWLAGSLWGLGEQEGLGGKIMKNSIQKSLGIPVDAWTDANGEVLLSGGKFGLLGAISQVFKMRSIRTDLTFFDKVNLLLSLGSVGRFSRTDIDLGKRGVIWKAKLSDGLDGYEIVTDRTTVGLDLLRDDRVFVEMKTLKVSNASSRSGLASEVSRVASVLGVRVLDTGSTEDIYRGTCLVTGEGEHLKSLAAKRIAQIYKCEKSIKKLGGAANLEFVIGDKFAKDF